MVDTIRERIIKKFKTIADDMVDNNEPVFHQIFRGTLDDIDAVDCPAIGIEEGEETVYDHTFPCISKILRVYVHVRFVHKEGVEPFEKFNYYLGKLHAAYYLDITLGALAIDVQEVGSAPQIDRAQNDPTPGGYIIFDIKYRHVNGDPYTVTP